MFRSAAIAGLGLLIASVQAQNATSQYVDPAVPTGTPVSGDYTGALRPQIHYSPPTGFMVRDRPSRLNSLSLSLVVWVAVLVYIPWLRNPEMEPSQSIERLRYQVL